MRWDFLCFRLLHTQVAFCCFNDANNSQIEANEIINELGIDKVPTNLLVTYYKVLSMLHFAKSDYNLSYDWSVKALELIGPNTPDKYVKIVFPVPSHKQPRSFFIYDR